MRIEREQLPQKFNQTIKNSFVKGLITERSELNFPEDASVDELNCSLFKAGNRSKRFGLDFETGHEESSNTVAQGLLYSTHTWENVGENPSLQYLVVQYGQRLRFYNKGTTPLSAGEVPTSLADSTPYVLDMAPYTYVGGLGADASKIAVASVKGRLVVVSPQIGPFYIERDATTGAFTVTQIDFTVRDLSFISDRVTLTEEAAASPSVSRQYDTYNAGWTTDTIATYKTANSNKWPALTHPWYSGKTAAGAFSAAEWAKIYSGNSLIAPGHFLLDLFNPDRDTASGLSGVPEAFTPTTRFNSVVAYAGRIWYGGIDSKIYYSQIVEDISQLGNCYQQNDPTSEEFSDLLDTDGGFVRLTEASGIRKLHVFGSSLLVFAENGVWRISGIDGNIFRATDFSVFKVTDFGLSVRGSFIAGQNSVPFWWSYSGIHTVQVTDQGGMVEVNISRDTIQTFWNEIDNTQKATVVSEYDAINNRIAWLYPNANETVDNKLNNILFLDVDLGAYYPWKISDSVGTPVEVVGTSFYKGSGADTITFTVVDSNGDEVQDSSGNTVVVDLEAGTLKSSEIFFLVRNTTTQKLTFATFTNTSFLDWDDTGYDAYAEAAYNFIGDLGRRKNSPYITAYMRQTETGFELSGSTYNPLRESSLKVSAYWDFKKTPSSSPQELYRHKQPLVVNTSDLTDVISPTTVLSTRLKLRGRGKVMRLRFEGVEGKDFNLLGWETLDAMNNGY